MGKLLRRIHHRFNRRRLEQELDNEMSTHREMMPPERRGAFGNTQRLHDESRDVWGWLWLDHVRQDLVFAMRGFVRDRRFALSAIGAISLAVGAATAVFSVVDRSLFRPLPYTQGDRLVSVEMIVPHFGLEGIMFSGAYRDWSVSQSAVALTSWNRVAECDLGGEAPERLHCARAEATFLPTIGVEPYLGRNFTPDEDREGAEPVALVSYGMWRSRFGADRTVLGKSIVLDGETTRIIGVLPSNFETPDLAPADLFVPQRLPQGPHTKNIELTVIGRLRSGQREASAAAALAGPFERFRLDFGQRVGGDFADNMKLHIELLRDQQNRQYRLALWVLLGAVAAFVLIACASVANLLLARRAGRRQEFAIRSALGGSRRRLVAQLLTESTLLGVAGGAAGCGLAWFLLRVFIAMAPDGTLRMREAAVDGRVLAFAAILSLGTAIVFGLAPPLDGLRVEDLMGGRATGMRRPWLRQILITGQLAMSLVLLAGAGLLLTSLVRLQNTPVGFPTERVVTATFTLPAYRYGSDLRPTGWSVRQFRFFDQLAERLKEMPGAMATAIADSIPPGPGPRTAPYVALANPGGNVSDPGMSGSVRWRYVSADYFLALGIPIRRGRSFSEADRALGAGNVVVNETLARRRTGDRDPIGKHLGRHTIIGVAADVRNAGLDQPVEPEFYAIRKHTGAEIPGSGDDAWWRRATAIVRSRLSERDTADLLRAAIRQVDPTVPIKVQTMEAQVGTFLTKPRFHVTLLVVFAITGLALAGIGLYGLISFLVVERTREIGVRIALGATPGEVTRLVVSDGVRWILAGVALGIAGSSTLLRLLSGLLYEVKALDPSVLVGAISVLAAVAILAAWLAAHRASRIDPMVALRHD
jgi:putative ABC transport system permease protein